MVQHAPHNKTVILVSANQALKERTVKRVRSIDRLFSLIFFFYFFNVLNLTVQDYIASTVFKISSGCFTRRFCIRTDLQVQSIFFRCK